MRKAAILVLSTALSANFAFANGGLNSTNDSFDANNEASFSGYQSYTQNNYSDGESYRINGVKCPVPTMVFGGNAAKTDIPGHDPSNFGISLGVQIPLFTGRCEDAADAELRKMQWQLVDAEQAALQKQEMHEMEKLRMCAFMVDQGFAPPDDLCSEIQKITTSEDLQAVFAK